MTKEADQPSESKNKPERPPPAPAVPPKPKWTPGKIKKASRDRLSGAGLAMTGKSGGLEWVLRGPREGDLGALGGAFQHIQALYGEFKALPELKGIAIANSIHITIGPSAAEEAAAARALGELAELEQESAPEVSSDPDEEKPIKFPGVEREPLLEPSRELDPHDQVDAFEALAPIDALDPPTTGRLQGLEAERLRLTREAVPNTVLANSVVLDLVRATSDETEESPLGRAMRYGNGVARTYRTLVSQLADSGLAMEASWPLDGRSFAVSNERLVELQAELSVGGTLDSFEVSVRGTLTMADADRLQFRLKFADDVARPDVLRDWRHGAISGTYSKRMRSSIRDRGLWDKDVIAKLRVKREERGSSAVRAKPDVQLIGVKPR